MTNTPSCGSSEAVANFVIVTDTKSVARFNMTKPGECDRCGDRCKQWWSEANQRWLYPETWIGVKCNKAPDSALMHFCSQACVEPQIAEFSSVEFFDIEKRGPVYTVDLGNEEDKDWTYMYAKLPIGGRVKIDGNIYTIRGVEHFMTGYARKHERVGILVGPVEGSEPHAS